MGTRADRVRRRPWPSLARNQPALLLAAVGQLTALHSSMLSSSLHSSCQGQTVALLSRSHLSCTWCDTQVITQPRNQSAVSLISLGFTDPSPGRAAKGAMQAACAKCACGCGSRTRKQSPGGSPDAHIQRRKAPEGQLQGICRVRNAIKQRQQARQLQAQPTHCAIACTLLMLAH